MRSILALRAKGLVLPSIQTSVVRAFRSLGVAVFDTPSPETEEDLTEFAETAKTGKWDAIFSVDLWGSQCLATSFREIQNLLKIPWIVWFVDDPEGYGFPQLCDPCWTLAFCWDKAILGLYDSWDGWPVTHLPLATDPSLFRMKPSGHQPLFPGGVFVGSTAHGNQLLDSVAEDLQDLDGEVARLWQAYSKDLLQSPHSLAWSEATRLSQLPKDVLERDPLWKLWVMACVRQLGIRKRSELVCRSLGNGSAVFGDEGWRDKVGPEIYRGPVPYGDEVCEIYNRSAFVLDVRQPQSRSGLTQRVYDGSACGRSVITEWSSELPELFDVDKELFFFRNLEECLEVKERCLREPEEARERGERAMARVLSQHTYLHRARRIMEEYARYRAL
jgi:spore maturation protein CgeB